MLVHQKKKKKFGVGVVVGGGGGAAHSIPIYVQMNKPDV